MIAEELRALLGVADLGAAIRRTMARVGEAAGLSRVLYLEERPRGGAPGGASDYHVRAEWCAPGVPDHAALGATVMDADAFGVFHVPGRRGESVWTRTDELDPAARALLVPFGVLAVGYAPVFVDAAYVGVVGFSDCRTARTWDAAHVDALTAAANAIGAALQGQRLRERLTHERERAAQARAVELARGYDVLRRAADGPVAAADLGGVLPVFLREAVAVAGASAGAVLRRVGPGTRFEFVTMLDARLAGGTGVTGDALARVPVAAATPDRSERDATGHFATLAAGRSAFSTRESLAAAVPESAEWARVHGHQAAWDVPATVRGEVVGFVRLMFPDGRESDATAQAVVATLADHIAVALDLTRLAEEGQQVAAAREREQAAQARVAALGRANAALRDGLQRLVGPGDLSAFLGHAVAVAAEQAGAARAALFRYDPERGVLRLLLAVEGGAVLEHGRPDDPPEFRRGIPAGDGEAWSRLVHGGAPRLHFFAPPDPPCSPFTMEWHGRRGHTGGCLLPLAGVHGPLGMLAMAFVGPYDVPGVQRELILALGNQITLALELDRLGAETRRGAVAEERTRIAGELHDTITQGLAAIVMQLGAARAKLGDAAERAAPELVRVDRLARSTLADARRAIVTIRPTAVAPDGLAEVLGRAVAALGESVPPLPDRVRPTLAVQGAPVRLPAEVEAELFRIAQAALTNAVQHAAAAAIRVELAFDPADGGVRVVVVDDGRGFDPGEPRPGRFGLVGMAERAARIGAVLTLVTAPGEGTHVVVNWRPS